MIGSIMNAVALGTRLKTFYENHPNFPVIGWVVNKASDYVANYATKLEPEVWDSMVNQIDTSKMSEVQVEHNKEVTEKVVDVLDSVSDKYDLSNAKESMMENPEAWGKYLTDHGMTDAVIDNLAEKVEKGEEITGADILKITTGGIKESITGKAKDFVAEKMTKTNDKEFGAPDNENGFSKIYAQMRQAFIQSGDIQTTEEFDAMMSEKNSHDMSGYDYVEKWSNSYGDCGYASDDVILAASEWTKANGNNWSFASLDQMFTDIHETLSAKYQEYEAKALELCGTEDGKFSDMYNAVKDALIASGDVHSQDEFNKAMCEQDSTGRIGFDYINKWENQRIETNMDAKELLTSVQNIMSEGNNWSFAGLDEKLEKIKEVAVSQNVETPSAEEQSVTESSDKNYGERASAELGTDLIESSSPEADLDGLTK